MMRVAAGLLEKGGRGCCTDVCVVCVCVCVCVVLGGRGDASI